MGAGQVGGRGAAAERQGELELVAEQAEDPTGALRSGGGEAPEGGPPDQHGVGAERERDRDVDAAADAAVDEDRGPAVDRLDDLRQRVGGGEGAVELAAAVVGDDDPGGAVLDRQLGVLGGQQALDEDRQAAFGGEVARGRPR